jgi:hypothetical protein
MYRIIQTKILSQMQDVVLWVLGGYGVVLFAVGGTVLRQSTQIAVLQKSVDVMTHQVQIFIKTEVDTLKDIAKAATK